MEFNFLAILVAAITPLILGFLWYNPKLFGNAWMREEEMTEEKMKGGNMAIIFGLTLVLSFLLALFVQFFSSLNLSYTAGHIYTYGYAYLKENIIIYDIFFKN